MQKRQEERCRVRTVGGHRVGQDTGRVGKGGRVTAFAWHASVARNPHQREIREIQVASEASYALPQPYQDLSKM